MQVNKNKGFTLIELLVVVLIIGILAAIALPQYQKAVKKSKMTQILMAGKALKTASLSYKLANGSYPCKETMDSGNNYHYDFSKLEITLPPASSYSYFYYKCENIFLVPAGRTPPLHIMFSLDKDEIICRDYSTNDEAAAFCKSWGNVYHTTSSSEWGRYYFIKF